MATNGRMEGNLTRRRFLGVASGAASAALVFPGRIPGLGAALGGRDGERHPLRMASEAAPRGLTLTAAPGQADIGGGRMAPGWLVNDFLPSPLLRVRRGESFDVRLENRIPDPLILHWHGLTPPAHADGHPHHAVRPGEAYDYHFTVENRAGTYWYHSHTHRRVARHTQAGIAGMILVGDDEEDALGLPSGEREIALVLQDRRLDTKGLPSYQQPDFMEGHHGEEPFGNGVRRPYLDVDAALYRFRLLNGSNARIFRLERSDARPLVLIGNDAGLLEAPAPVEYLDLAPGERADVLVDLSELREGERVMLRSRPFEVSGFVMELGGHNPHALAMDLLELRVGGRREAAPPLPRRLSSSLVLPDPAQAAKRRRFRFSFERDPFSRTMEQHHINGLEFDMERADERVPFGQTEIWSFVNDNWFAHPVHLHGTHFRVLSREGGRGRVMPWEAGLKDTVLVHPQETVEVAVRFTAHRGLFPLHCHNLEHEDLGMMLNVLVE
jgi:FtsP/CotA-like multicopper oxidase with cupredoxin domain